MDQMEHALIARVAQLNTREEFLRGNSIEIISSNRWKNRVVLNAIDIKQSLIAHVARLII